MKPEPEDSSPNTKTVRTGSKPSKKPAGARTTAGRKRKQQTLPIEERFKAVRPDAKYVSDSGQEYVIEKNSIGHHWIKRYKGGNVNPELKGVFTSFWLAEEALISYLRQTDKLNRAWYPGKKNARTDLPYGPSQRE